MVRNEKKIVRTSAEKKSFKRVSGKKKFVQVTPEKKKCSIFFFYIFLVKPCYGKKCLEGRRKKIVRRNLYHAPQMINGNQNDWVPLLLKDLGPPCAPWCTMQVAGAQSSPVPSK